MGTKKTNPSNSVQSTSNILKEEEEEDKISNLSQDLHIKILSLLNRKEAVATSVLSKRWRFLWTSTANFEFHYDRVFVKQLKKQTPTSFIRFVDRVMLLNDSPSIRNLSLFVTQPLDHLHINKWISDAVSRNLKGLQLFMKLDVFISMRDRKELPDSVFYCNTLEVLKLSGPNFLFRMPKPKATSLCFPNLKTLCLKHVFVDCGEISVEEGFFWFPVLKTLELELLEYECDYEEDDDSVSKLVTNSPLLEHLLISMERMSSNIDICALLLTSLEIYLHNEPYYGKTYNELQIDTPSLQYLTISDWDFADKILVIDSNFLIEVKLINAYSRSWQSYNAHELIKAVDKVQRLLVKNSLWEDRNYFIQDISDGMDFFPLLCNLTKLEVDVRCSELSKLQHLLENSVNLQHLILNKNDACDCRMRDVEEKLWLKMSVVTCFHSALTRFEILHVAGCTYEVALIKYILQNAEVLEKMTISPDYRFKSSNRYKLLQETITLLSRGSNECELHFI